MTTLGLLARRPALRLIGVALLLMGVVNASVYPYQSLIAIERVGLSEPVFALVLLLASSVAVTTSVLVGILTDQRGRRRRTAILTAATGVLGMALMLAAPGAVSLILCHALLLPVFSSLFGQLFALARLACFDLPTQRDAILSNLRAALSLTFVLVLTAWSFVFAAGADVMAVYITAGLGSLLLLGLIALGWPRDGQTPWRDDPSGINLLQSFRDIARGPVLLRLLLLGSIGAGPMLYMVLASLVFEAAPLRDASDAALYIGMVAGWEVPFMLILPRLAGRVRRTVLIGLGAAVYTLHVLLMPLLVGSAAIWVLPLLGGLGGAAILTLPIAYFQDLMTGRPGTGTSLLALQRVVSDALSAGAFALGTALGGYALAALIGTAIALAGALGLYLADRPQRARG